ncbi:PAS domain S-box protein [Halorubellus litoreus]|uniref:histidine kinase n=1 Tax=Halorubellus litoreus TaxID=755308 RepID=A0ABD5VB52_9EURY
MNEGDGRALRYSWTASGSDEPSERFKMLVGTLEDAVFELDGDDRLVAVNDALVAQTGYESSALFGEDASTLVAEQDETAFVESLAALRSASSDDPSTFDVRVDSPTGDRVHWSVQLAAVDEREDDERVVGVARDVTAERARAEERRKYEHILETVQDGVYVVDTNGRFTLVNDAFVDFFGYERETLLGEHVSTVVDDEIAERAADRAAALEADRAEDPLLEADVETATGEALTAVASFGILPGEDDRFHRVGVVRNVTERRARERALEESERRYRTLVENFPEGAVGLFDEDFRFTAVGGELMTEIGTNPAERVGEYVFDLYPEDVVREIRPYFEGAIAGEKHSFEIQYRGRDLLAHTLPVSGDDEVFGGMLVVQDISERRERERELSEERERLAAVNNLHEVALEVNRALARQRSREQIEAAVCEHLGSSDSYTFAWVGSLEREGVGADERTRVVPSSATDESMTLEAFDVDLDAPVEEMGPDERAMATGTVQVSSTVSAAPADGFWRAHAEEMDVVAVASVPVRFEDEPFAVLNVYTDREDAFGEVERGVLTQLGEIMGLAMAAAARAETVAWERERFELLNRLIRHNLLNSLNVVGARLELLEGHVDEAVLGHLETVQVRTREMTRVVETIRHVMQAIGDENHELEPVALGSMVAEQVERARSSYPAASFEVCGDLNEVGPVMADELLGEVLENLLSNAVEHNDADEPRVRVGVSSSDRAASVWVADDGPGVSAEMRERLFEKGERRFDSPGSGFGLYLVREIVHAYDGVVEVEASEMGGARFEVTLPTPDDAT